jgi:hypothetical protein
MHFGKEFKVEGPLTDSIRMHHFERKITLVHFEKQSKAMNTSWQHWPRYYSDIQQPAWGQIYLTQLFQLLTKRAVSLKAAAHFQQINWRECQQ